MTILTPAKRFVRRLERERVWRLHRARLGNASSAYVEAQLRRTLAKRNQPLQPRTRFLVDRLAAHVPLAGARVLCVGCRNVRELDCLQSKGAASTTGIDLFSEHPRILVGDMHQLPLAAGCFDVVYSSHSLEHAYDAPRAIAEFARVLKPGGVVLVEVPVRYPTSDADLVDFGSVTGLAAAFAVHGAVTVWQEEEEAATGNNAEGYPVARLIVRIDPVSRA